MTQTPRSSKLWLVLTIGILLLPSLVWTVEDREPWRWDPSWYGQVSVDLWYLLTHSPVQWVGMMADGLDMKPPGVVWLGQFFVPLGGIFGSIEGSLLFSVLLTQVATLVLLFRMGRRIAPSSRFLPLLGLLVGAGGQLFLGLSHQFFAEPMQALASTWAFYAALMARDWPKARLIIHLWAALVFGLLSKATTPLYVAVPFAYCAYVLLRGNQTSGWRSELRVGSTVATACGGAVLSGLAGAWYLRHIRAAWQHVHDASFGPLALEYGTRDSVLHKLVTWFGLFKQVFLGPYLTWGALVLVLAALVVAWRRRRTAAAQSTTRFDPILPICVLQIVLILLVFSLNITVDSRYLFALLPCVVLIVVRLCAAAPRALVIAFSGMASWQWIVLNGVALGVTGPVADQSQWLTKVQPNASRYAELRKLVHLTADAAGRYNIIAVEQPWLNANNTDFFAAKERLQSGIRSYYTSLGYAQNSVDGAMRRIEEFKTRYLITLKESEQDATPNFLNVVALPVLKIARGDSRFRDCRFATAHGVVVFRFSSGLQEPGDQSQACWQESSDAAHTPPELSGATVRPRGKSALGFVNGAAALIKAGERQFVSGNGRLLSCNGWAFDDFDNSTPADVRIELTSSATGQKYYWRAQRYPRPELAKALKLPSIGMSGIECGPLETTLPAGAYKAKVYQVHAGVAAVSDFATYEKSPIIVVQH